MSKNSRLLSARVNEIEQLILSLHDDLVTAGDNAHLELPGVRMSVRPDGRELVIDIRLGVNND